MTALILTITIIITGLIGGIGGNYTKKPEPSKVIAQMYETVDIDLVAFINQ